MKPKKMNIYNVYYDVKVNKDFLGLTGTQTEPRRVRIVAESVEEAIEKAKFVDGEITSVNQHTTAYI